MKLGPTLFFLLAGASVALAEPQMSVCEAVQRAEKHLQQTGVDRTGQHIQQVRLQYDPGKRAPYWEIIWAWDSARLGMELTARVYSDGSVEWRRLGP